MSVKKYAKTKAMYIKKCLDNNETPIAGPLISDDGDNLAQYNEPANFPQNTYVEKPAVAVQPQVPAVPAESPSRLINI